MLGICNVRVARVAARFRASRDVAVQYKLVILAERCVGSRQDIATSYLVGKYLEGNNIIIGAPGVPLGATSSARDVSLARDVL